MCTIGDDRQRTPNASWLSSVLICYFEDVIFKSESNLFLINYYLTIKLKYLISFKNDWIKINMAMLCNWVKLSELGKNSAIACWCRFLTPKYLFNVKISCLHTPSPSPPLSAALLFQYAICYLDFSPPTSLHWAQRLRQRSLHRRSPPPALSTVPRARPQSQFPTGHRNRQPPWGRRLRPPQQRH